MAAVLENAVRKWQAMPVNYLFKGPQNWSRLNSKYFSSYQTKLSSALHHENENSSRGFKFIEYDTGPCTADKIVLQADKYGSSLAECVSSDFEMDKGLAKYFKKSFKHKELLKEKAVSPGKAAIVEYKDCYIYYLVTRERWWDRGCYKYLKTALADVRDHCRDNKVNELCMGRLGCGVDGLDWIHVRELIKEAFKDIDITIKAQITR